MFIKKARQIDSMEQQRAELLNMRDNFHRELCTLDDAMEAIVNKAAAADEYATILLSTDYEAAQEKKTLLKENIAHINAELRQLQQYENVNHRHKMITTLDNTTGRIYSGKIEETIIETDMLNEKLRAQREEMNAVLASHQYEPQQATVNADFALRVQRAKHGKSLEALKLEQSSTPAHAAV